MSNAPHQGWQPPAQGGPGPQGYQPYAPSYAAPGHPGAGRPRRGSGLALTSVLLAGAAAVASPIIAIALRVAMIGGMTPGTYGLLSFVVNGLVVGVLAIGGLVLGIVAVRGDAKALAGAGIGANAIVLLSLLASSAIAPLLQLFY